MNNDAERIKAEYNYRLTAYIEQAADDFIEQRINNNLPREKAIQRFNRQVEEYTNAQTDIYALEMAAAGAPMSAEAIEDMKKNIIEAATTRNSKLIAATDKAAGNE